MDEVEDRPAGGPGRPSPHAGHFRDGTYRTSDGTAGRGLRDAHSVSRCGENAGGAGTGTRRGIRDGGTSAARVRLREPARAAIAADTAHDGRGAIPDDEADGDSGERVARAGSG